MATIIKIFQYSDKKILEMRHITSNGGNGGMLH